MREGSLCVAVVGATGAVGREIVELLSYRQFPFSELKLFASEVSVGTELDCQEQGLLVEGIEAVSFRGVDLVFLCCPPEIARDCASQASKHKCAIIDLSGAFSSSSEVPLIVPEANAALLRSVLRRDPASSDRVFAVPQGVSTALVVALKPISEQAGIERVHVASYQAVSGLGQKGMEELWQQSLSVFNQGNCEPEVFSEQIAFNVIPQCGEFNAADSNTSVETSLIEETRRILDNPSLRISATAARVPVFGCNSLAVNVELKKELTPELCRKLLSESPGLIVLDEGTEGVYPHSVTVVGTDAVYVGRIRADDSLRYGLSMWIVCDALRKGAALNAVQVAELLIVGPGDELQA